MRREAIDKFLDSKLSKDEMEDIFIPETRRVCQTCHKVRLRKKIDRGNFSPVHRRLICIGLHHNQNNNNQPNQANNLNQNNNDNNQGDNNNANNIEQDNFGGPDNNDDMDIDMLIMIFQIIKMIIIITSIIIKTLIFKIIIITTLFKITMIILMDKIIITLGKIIIITMAIK